MDIIFGCPLRIVKISSRAPFSSINLKFRIKPLNLMCSKCTSCRHKYRGSGQLFGPLLISIIFSIIKHERFFDTSMSLKCTMKRKHWWRSKMGQKMATIFIALGLSHYESFAQWKIYSLKILCMNYEYKKDNFLLFIFA